MSWGEAIPRKFTSACASCAYIWEFCELGSLLSDVRSASSQHRSYDANTTKELTGFQSVNLFSLIRNITTHPQSKGDAHTQALSAPNFCFLHTILARHRIASAGTTGASPSVFRDASDHLWIAAHSSLWNTQSLL